MLAATITARVHKPDSGFPTAVLPQEIRGIACIEVAGGNQVPARRGSAETAAANVAVAVHVPDIGFSAIVPPQNVGMAVGIEVAADERRHNGEIIRGKAAGRRSDNLQFAGSGRGSVCHPKTHDTVQVLAPEQRPIAERSELGIENSAASKNSVGACSGDLPVRSSPGKFRRSPKGHDVRSCQCRRTLPCCRSPVSVIWYRSVPPQMSARWSQATSHPSPKDCDTVKIEALRWPCRQAR